MPMQSMGIPTNLKPFHPYPLARMVEWCCQLLGSSVGLNRCRAPFTVAFVRGSSGFSTSTRDGPSARWRSFLCQEFLEGNSYQKGDTRQIS